jgi:hypothetical protein
VPAIGVDAPLVDLGVGGDGAIEVPTAAGDAGWLTTSSLPGERGPAVVAGHVALGGVPAVFADLDELAPGDDVVLVLEDGTEVPFSVDAVESFPKDAFPTDRVYGPTPALVSGCRGSEAGEPQPDLAGGRLRRVGPVDEVLLDLQAPVAAEVAADGARRRGRGVGRAGEAAEALDAALALDDDGGHGPRRHELEERLVEGLALVLGVVGPEDLAVGGAQVERDEAVALRLDAAEHLPDEATGDAVGLDEHERALTLRGVGLLVGHGGPPGRRPGRPGAAARRRRGAGPRRD